MSNQEIKYPVVLDEIYVAPFPKNETVDIKRAIRGGSNEMVLVATDGRLFHNRKYGYTAANFSQETLRQMASAGLIRRRDVDKHFASKLVNEKVYAVTKDKKEMLRIAELYGIKLTREQRAVFGNAVKAIQK